MRLHLAHRKIPGSPQRVYTHNAAGAPKQSLGNSIVARVALYSRGAPPLVKTPFGAPELTTAMHQMRLNVTHGKIPGSPRRVYTHNAAGAPKRSLGNSIVARGRSGQREIVAQERPRAEARRATSTRPRLGAPGLPGVSRSPERPRGAGGFSPRQTSTRDANAVGVARWGGRGAAPPMGGRRGASPRHGEAGVSPDFHSRTCIPTIKKTSQVFGGCVSLFVS